MPASASIGLFFVRIVVGAALALHGYAKIANPTGWMAHSLTAPWSGAAIAVPDWLQGAVVAVEFLGGIALVLGLFTRLAALALFVDMLVAFVFAELPHGTAFVGTGHTLEPNLTYLVVNFMLLLTGPGTISIDAVTWRTVAWNGRRTTEKISTTT